MTSRLGVVTVLFSILWDRILFSNLVFFNTNAGVTKMAFRASLPCAYCVNAPLRSLANYAL